MNEVYDSSKHAKSISASDGNDSFVFQGNANKNTIDAGAGNDTIVFESETKTNSINLGDGNDSVYFDSRAEKNTIIAGDGNDTIYFASRANENSIDAGDGRDLIVFDGRAKDNVIVNFGAGDSIQFVSGSNDKHTYSFTDGSIVDGDYVVSLIVSRPNDNPDTYQAVRIVGVGSNLKNMGDGLFIYPAGNYYSIDGSKITAIDGDSIATEYDDTIYAENLATSINAGAGSDIISVMSGSGIIDGGSGADQIYLGSDVDVTIVGSGDVVSLGNGNWAIGEDTIHGVEDGFGIVSAGSGLYSLAHLGNHFSIDGSRVTQVKYGTIATEYSDTIYAENLSTSINARGGDDIISIMSGSGTIDGGSGADKIYLGTTDVTIVGSGDVSQTGSIWTIGEDSIFGVADGYKIVRAGDNLFKIASEGLSAIGLMVDSNAITSSDEDVDLSEPTNVAIDESGNIVFTGSTESDAVISVDAETKSATLIINDSDKNYNLTFYDGGLVEKWNATLSSGNDQINIGNVKGGNFDGGDGKDYFHVTKNLQGNISLTGGATNDNLESGNNFYAESSTVASSSSQNKITITDVNFNASDVILIDAGVENLTSEFFGDSRFYNYSSASDASTSGVYAGTIFDASDLVKNLGMSFSMLRVADKSRVTLDDENAIDENYITNVIWANADSATIDFSQYQTDEVLVFTNTNSRGDIVSLGGDYDDTIHAGASDTIDAGGGDDLIYLNRRNHVVFGSSEGNDTIYGWDSTDTLDFSEIPDVSISSDGLYLESDKSMMLIEGSFTNSTNIRYNDGIMRVADSNGNVVYNKNVTYYAGSTLIMNSSSNNTIDLSSSTYENISLIDASNASGRDTFRYTSDAGDVTISNGDSKDVVDLSSYTVDEISAEFTDTGLVITIDDSNLNIVGTNLTQFSLASGKYTADFANQTLSE